MNLALRINLVSALGGLMTPSNPVFAAAAAGATAANPWFTPEFIELATQNIRTQFLDRSKLEAFAEHYKIPELQPNPKKVGVLMAGNIPLVGFHDLLCVFLAGHSAVVKLSSKDEVLMKFAVESLNTLDPRVEGLISFASMLKGCDAYIATGSNNSARYFDYYFAKYPHIIRRNRTSVAILNGNEKPEDLARLADDIHAYFGLGCRNVTKLYVPAGYDFVPLIASMTRYRYFSDHNKYKNNYDYQLAIALLNHQYYMTNETTLLIENASFFSPISQLNYETYTDRHALLESLTGSEDLQCVVGEGGLPFGQAQVPGLADFADGKDTMRFLLTL